MILVFRVGGFQLIAGEWVPVIHTVGWLLELEYEYGLFLRMRRMGRGGGLSAAGGLFGSRMGHG